MTVIRNVIIPSILVGICSIQTSYAQCTGRYDDCQKLKQQEGVKINGLMQGSIRETNNSIYIKNIKIYQENSNQPALQVITSDNPLDGAKKRVIVDNVQVNVKNANVSTDYGLAASVAFHFENEGNMIKNLTVNSSGVNKYTSRSSVRQNAAGVQVEQYKGKAAHTVNSSNNVLNTSGQEIIHSIQNLP